MIRPDHITLQEFNTEPRFQDEIKNNKKVEKLIECCLKLEGLNRNMATHAAGVVIAGDELSDQIPLYIDHSIQITFTIHTIRYVLF